jgi:hypothetical protein
VTSLQLRTTSVRLVRLTVDACFVTGSSSRTASSCRLTHDRSGRRSCHGSSAARAVPRKHRPNWPEPNSVATIRQNQPQTAGLSSTHRDADRVPSHLQIGIVRCKGAIASHARGRYRLLAAQRPLEPVSQPHPDRRHRALGVKPARRIDLLPTLDRGSSAIRGQPAAPEPASVPPARLREEAFRRERCSPTCSPRPHAVGERVIRISRPKAKFVRVSDGIRTRDRRDQKNTRGSRLEPRRFGPWITRNGCDQDATTTLRRARASGCERDHGCSGRASELQPFAARKCETLRGPASGRRVSNPRPSAWEANVHTSARRCLALGRKRLATRPAQDPGDRLQRRDPATRSGRRKCDPGQTRRALLCLCCGCAGVAQLARAPLS